MGLEGPGGGADHGLRPATRRCRLRRVRKALLVSMLKPWLFVEN
jgi:hypothetical protein